MDYATQNYIGDNHDSQTAKATAIVPTVKRVYELDATTQRCARNTQRQTKIRTSGNAADGFLKCTFLPKLKESKTIQDCGNVTSLEKDFYSSLSLLAKHYRIEPMQTQQFAFPYNLALALSDFEEKLKQKVADFEEIRLVQDGKKTYFISEERYRTGTTLFYIPITPLYRMLHNRKHKRNAHLLLSVCSYLYYIADIPYYRQESSYLYWMYEMMNDWVEQDDYTEETQFQLAEIIQAEYIGDSMEQKLYNVKNITVWKQRIKGFKAKGDFDKGCLSITKEAFAIYQTFPNENIFRNASLYSINTNRNDNEDDEDRDNTVKMKQYISFYADNKGWLSDRLIDAVNAEMQECTEIEEPVIQKHFDGRDITYNNLDFENLLFGLLHRLCDLLNNY